MGTSILDRASLLDSTSLGLSLASYTTSSGASWFVLWLPPVVGVGTSDTDQCCTATNTCAAVVHQAPDCACSGCWSRIVCGALYRTHFCLQVDVPRQIVLLLCLWLLEHHFGSAIHHHSRDGHHHHIHTALCRELSLVVAVVFCGRRIWILDFRLFDVVLHHSVAYRWVCEQSVVFQLQRFGVCSLFIGNRDNWVPDGVYVCSSNIQWCQGGLKTWAGQTPRRFMKYGQRGRSQSSIVQHKYQYDIMHTISNEKRKSCSWSLNPSRESGKDGPPCNESISDPVLVQHVGALNAGLARTCP